MKNNSFEKVCLIIPQAAFLLDARVFVNLGILKVAAMLERAGVGVDVLDLSGISNFVDVVIRYLELNPDISYFGLTATTPQMPTVKTIITTIRSNRPNSRIVLGGPHVTLVNSAFKMEQKLGQKGRAVDAMNRLVELFDVLVAGDGELAIFETLKERCRKFIDADATDSPLFLSNEKLTELPFPARHLIDFGSYHYSIDGVNATSLIAQLGCPFACGFCGGRSSNMLRKIRTRTTDHIISEMIHIHKQAGCNGFMFYDDELNVNPNMILLMNAIKQAQQELGVQWKLRGFVKSQLLTHKQAESMYDAGFRWILVGFESGSEDILTVMNKKATRDQNTMCMKIAKECGLKVKALMSLGHPGESSRTIQDTKDWLIETKPDDFDATIITCYPGTPYYDHAKPCPDKGENIWLYEYPPTKARLYQIGIDYMLTEDYYKGDPEGGYRSYVFTDKLTPDELVQHRNDLEKNVRRELGIKFNPSTPALQFEHSMGQHGNIPDFILRSSGH